MDSDEFEKCTKVLMRDLVGNIKDDVEGGRMSPSHDTAEKMAHAYLFATLYTRLIKAIGGNRVWDELEAVGDDVFGDIK